MVDRACDPCRMEHCPFGILLRGASQSLGYAHGYTGGQLKIMQEVITLCVFAVFAVVILKEPISWRYIGAVACIVGAAAFLFVGRN